MISGLVLLDKPVGVSSFQALRDVKRAAGTKKVGHAGTLDPFASGLLIALSGSMTKLVPDFMGLKKEYHAVVRFGAETDTLDPTGSVVREADLPDRDEAVQAALDMIGEIDQVPPMYSAIKVNGERLYAAARRGEQRDVKARRVRIHQLEVVAWVPPEMEVRVVCSKGTYMRSLARDIGKAAHSAASLEALRRISIGQFQVSEAVSPGTCTGGDFVTGRDLFSKLKMYEAVGIKPGFEQRILHGEEIRPEWLDTRIEVEQRYALFDGKDRFVASVDFRGGKFAYFFVANRLD